MKPSIGRQVHYRPTAEENEQIARAGGNKQEKLPATVTAVWGDDVVNLRVLHDGPGDTWKTSAHRGELEGQWEWPVLEK